MLRCDGNRLVRARLTSPLADIAHVPPPPAALSLVIDHCALSVHPAVAAQYDAIDNEKFAIAAVEPTSSWVSCRRASRQSRERRGLAKDDDE